MINIDETMQLPSLSQLGYVSFADADNVKDRPGLYTDDFDDKGSVAEYLYCAIRWFWPQHMKCSFFVQNMFTLQAACQDVSVMMTPLYGVCSVKSVAEFISTNRSTHRYLVVPLMLQGYTINHIVVIIVDTETQQMIYYDPKGCNPFMEMRKAHSVQVSRGIPCSMLVICKTVQDNSKCNLFFSSAVDQSWQCPLSCGALCAQFIERYVLFPDTFGANIHLLRPSA